MTQKDTARTLLAEHGRTFADEAGITLVDKPSPLYRLLVLSVLLSARISSELAVAASRELSRALMTTPAAMARATWQDRVDALGRGGYRRFDERSATMLGDGAGWLKDRYRGDLRRLHEEHEGDVDGVRTALREHPGIGPLGSAIFVREVQGLWSDLAPFADERVSEAATRLGLPASARRLEALVGQAELPRLLGAIVRAARKST